ncbi:hypothetical protein PS914_03205 [Pseudomonas fluorescens]|uniref:hypothetical protein n=1 Tax=Pseudomonas fluorescens TaxID=294 RepID=UPI00123F5DDA|nr:hypothetical protein [Pseudomonas fluorescens]VVP91861.1 hypothetical protein PS914_03205 [Pseudomonas fluorescens]
MSGKVLGIIGAVILAVFTVALDKYWDTAFIQGIVQGTLNLPEAIQRPVGVPLWLVVAAALLLVAMLLRVCWILVQRKFERETSHSETSYVKPLPKPVSIELPIYVNDDQKRILSFLGYAEDNNSMVSLSNLCRSVNLTKLKYDYALQQLQKASLVLIHEGHGDGPEIMLTEKGKEFIVTKYISTQRHAWYGYT